VLRTQPWVSEDVGLIPGLAQWIKDLVLPSCSIVRRQDSDLALLWLWCRLAAEAPIQPLAWERPYAAGTALKRTTAKKGTYSMGTVSAAAWVKDQALLQLWCRSQLWLGFDSWPRNLHTPWV